MSVKTVRELVDIHPEMHDYHYKWRDTGLAELEKSLGDVLASFGYKLTPEDAEFDGEYNDIKAYYNCEIVHIDTDTKYCAFCDNKATFMVKNTKTPLCSHCRSVYQIGQASPNSEIVCLEG